MDQKKEDYEETNKQKVSKKIGSNKKVKKDLKIEKGISEMKEEPRI